MRIGLLGGTFDPVHCGHLAVARLVKDTCALDRVWLIPAARSPFRGTPHAAADHRLAMCRLAVRDRPWLEVKDLELTRPAPSYTIDTLRTLTKAHPDSVFTLIVGTDALEAMAAWRDTDGIFALSEVIAVARPGFDAALPDDLVRDHPAAATRVRILPDAASEVAASDVRRRIAAGDSLDGLVPRAVADYIGRHGLYGHRDAAEGRI
ncbi:MAG: nicotinate-nucleotide adenylyltransferase [Chloroflexi bacterium]|nr:nicotinate-nucleotide adenylyltransferase [Chloroflexota bacterium]